MEELSLGVRAGGPEPFRLGSPLDFSRGVRFCDRLEEESSRRAWIGVRHELHAAGADQRERRAPHHLGRRVKAERTDLLKKLNLIFS
jgi:hypothetical protein